VVFDLRAPDAGAGMPDMPEMPDMPGMQH